MERKSSMVADRRLSMQEPAELDRNTSIDRVLKSTNPYMTATPVYFDFKKDARTYKFVPTVDHTALHFTVDGNVIRSDTDEAKRLNDERERRMKELEKAEEAERNPDLVEQGVSTKILKNQFNYSERASQTMNNPLRSHLVMTDPPPTISLANSASQWEIYDAYKEEQAAAERAAAAGKKRGGKDDEKRGRGGDARQAEGDDAASSPAYAHALKIIERMVNQNDSHDIIDDYKFWEDESDKFKEDGTLLPLWKFHSDKVRKREVTCISWNPRYNDLFAVGYGSYDFVKATTMSSGAIQCFTLKNAFPTGGQGQSMPAHPEFFFQLEAGVMCLDFHPNPQFSSYLACGLYDGSVCVFDLRQKYADKSGDKDKGEKKLKPIFSSSVKNGKHSDPVWEVRWSANTDTLQFFSVSSDGRVTNWTLAKNELQYTDVMKLTMGDQVAKDESKANDPEAALVGLSGGTCFDFHKNTENVFLVGTEEGHIRRCSKAYNAEYLETYDGHHMAVYAVRWNAFHPNVFLSCGADWNVRVWKEGNTRALLSFDLSQSVGDAVWAPYSSTVFAAVADTKVYVFDLNKNKNEPLCSQPVTKNAKLTRVCFNPKEPVVLVGDSRGTVISLKLSPNLRQRVKPEKGQADDPQALRNLEIEKLDRLIAITLKDRELLDGK